MQRTKRNLSLVLILLGLIISAVNPVSIIFNLETENACAGTSAIPSKYQVEIIKIRNKQTASGSIVSEHINIKECGQTIIKMLEIPEHQLSVTIEQWGQLGHEIKENTIDDKEFIQFLINNTDVKSYSYTAKIPRLYFLVKNEIAEPILYGGKITKFFKTISFHGWFRIAGALDTQGNYRKGYEHLGTQKEALLELFRGVLSETVKGCYTIVELYTDENGERKGRFKFFKTAEQTEPSFVQPIDAMAAFVLTYLNLVQENPGDMDVKKDLTKPIVERFLVQAQPQNKVAFSAGHKLPQNRLMN